MSLIGAVVTCLLAANRGSNNRVFTRSSKLPSNVFKIHVLIAGRLLDVCWIV